jgi:pimeloyl-ACP methyl ester carboxylesterase
MKQDGERFEGREMPVCNALRGTARHKARRRPPNYRFDDATYNQTAASFDNPDFVDVVIQSYRHRHGAALGDPALEAIEAQLAPQPSITVPTISLHGECDGVAAPEGLEGHAPHFAGVYESRVIPVAGHFLPREAPEAVTQAINDLDRSRPSPSR